MALMATAKGGGERTLPPAGTFLARCYAICDMGTQFSEWQGKPKKARKCRIFFELPTEKHVFLEEKGEEPFTMSKEFTLSLHAKAQLRKVLDTWRGKPFTEEELDGFDVTKLIGAPAMLTIGHEPRKDGEGDFAKILGIAKVMKGIEVPPMIMKAWQFTLDMGQQSETFKALPEWLREKILDCEEWTEPVPANTPAATPPPGHEPIDDEVPF